ncbi:hypothetical protein SDC9_90079 [bioreactor metagenome]|uniref:Uncharacterized protein n=1 Tax=bioreactor metagenome TaxID=1076179 RepID=A0A644ZRM0_9ZZZZ
MNCTSRFRPLAKANRPPSARQAREEAVLTNDVLPTEAILPCPPFASAARKGDVLTNDFPLSWAAFQQPPCAGLSCRQQEGRTVKPVRPIAGIDARVPFPYKPPRDSRSGFILLHRGFIRRAALQTPRPAEEPPLNIPRPAKAS